MNARFCRRTIALLIGLLVVIITNVAPASVRAATINCDAASYPSLDWTLCETANLAVSQESQTLFLSLFPQTAAATAAYQTQFALIPLQDPQRSPNPSPCPLTCIIDQRINNWNGQVIPVLYTSRSGATMSGHIFAANTGPAKRPGIVINNGSIIGYEQAYWYAAEALARAGFIVMAFDARGEGMSDQFGEAPDQLEDAFASIPLTGLLAPPPGGPSLGGNGLTFYDGGADALDFFLSTPGQPYVPVPSRSTGTSHAAKQASRVASGKNNAYNPLWQMLDTNNIGLAGHSYGAIASSYLGQADPRVKTVVAWDSLCIPVQPSLDEVTALLTDPANNISVLGLPVYTGRAIPSNCLGAPPVPLPAITKPALGINADYLLTVTPYTQPPEPLAKSTASRAYSAAGVDTGNITIRGGTHLDFADLPLPGAPIAPSLRGIDITTWYTVAWFRKYLMNDPAADLMLTSDRWRNDAAGGAVDPNADSNLYSWHYQSRMNIGLTAGGRFVCENLRQGCAGQTAAANDGQPTAYSFVSAGK